MCLCFIFDKHYKSYDTFKFPRAFVYFAIASLMQREGNFSMVLHDAVMLWAVSGGVRHGNSPLLTLVRHSHQGINTSGSN